MTATTLLSDFWSALGGVFRLEPQAFVDAASMTSRALAVAAVVVFLAGLSEAIAQSIVLFANRVKPVRFFFSWAIDAFLFVFGYGFLVLSTWAVCRLPGTPHLPLSELATVLALSYAPLLFSFLGAMPYLGPGILRLLRVWHLLAMIVGVAAVGNVGFVRAAGFVALGWIVMMLAQQSFGRPIALLGTRVLDAVAGVRLVDDENAIVGKAQAGLQSAPQAAASLGIARPAPSHPNAWKVALGLLGVAALAFAIALALDPARNAMFGWQDRLPRALQLPIDLLWLGVIAIVVAALMAPLETLGWWAGWYGDEIGVAEDTDAIDDRTGENVTRYVVYLDGIAQSSGRYTPDIETFLDALAPDLPQGMRLIRGVMSYSVLNRPLEDDPLFSRFWAFIDGLRLRNAASILGMIVNLRNVTIVAVSADPRYGPMYNFGIARVIYRSLLANGYRPRSGTPVTLIGYSGGGQMSCGSAGFLKRAIDAPIDVISLGGVISGNDPILELEHLYHLVGSKDRIEPIGPIMFPSRWKTAVLSNWNRAKRLGRLTWISLGPVGHQVPGGMLDPQAKLPDGRTNLRQTLDVIEAILTDRLTAVDAGLRRKTSNYDRYVRAAWNRPEYYPLSAPPPDPKRYRPIAEWIGRLILPARDARFGGALFEIHHAPEAYADLIGSCAKLIWNEADPAVAGMLRAVRRDLTFSAQAEYTSTYAGFVHPVRLNRWRLVDPLESLAGSHPIDDVIVKLPGAVGVERTPEGACLTIERQPVQIAGRWYALVRFTGAAGEDDADALRVVHFDARTGAFDGGADVFVLPAPVDDAGGRPPSISAGLAASPLNADGWYAYGAFDARGRFVVRSLAPRALLRVDGAAPAGTASAYRYVRRDAWKAIARECGGCLSTALDDVPWRAGDVALLVHVYGGIGGPSGEPEARGPLYFGHFAYGVAEVVADPLAAEPRFDITYYQVYTHNPDGVIAGAQHWSRYMGDRQFGWAGLRPVCDLVLRHDAFVRVALEPLTRQLDAMTARYRIGDGTGGTYVGAANNCSQDSNRALFATLRGLRKAEESPGPLHRVARDLRRKLQPFGAPRRDWSDNDFNLGSTMEDAPIQNVVTALGSWRCILPRLAADTIAETFFADGAAGRVLGSDAVGGERSDIAPVIPFAL
ncbi:MAG TPA: hypothetical protein VMF61_04580 [Candidatus Acidoferrales bacterium]|nr:hypothetical protein [Candidatus Acidoferrales bacterium]